MAFCFTKTYPEDSDIKVINPVSITEKGTQEREFVFEFSGEDIYENNLVFFSKHQYIEVYCDGKMVYEYTEDGGIWGHTTGVNWNFIDIPHGTTQLRVTLVSAYDNVKDNVPEFRLGDKLTIFRDIYRKSIPTLLISILIIIFGVVLIIYWVFVVSKFDIGRTLLYLGVLSILIGLYSLNETNAAIIGIQHRVACVFVTYLLLIILSPATILFVREFLGTVENVIWRLICTASVIEFVVCLTLQFLNIKDLRETLIITHIIIFVTAVYILYTLGFKLVRHDYSSMLKSSLIGVIILILAVFSNLISYYNNTSIADTGVIGRAGFFIFIFILSRESVKSSIGLMKKGRQAKKYEELAVNDMLTNMNNRNAYISDINSINEYKDVMIITFDLNNLKKCNDVLGHTEGDFYILSSANIIKEIFLPYGRCYRIGGDEFCVLVKNASQCPISQLIKKLNEEEQSFNMGKHKFHMHIAYGYAIFDNLKDSDLEQTRDRADNMMYENKRKSKQSR